MPNLPDISTLFPNQATARRMVWRLALGVLLLNLALGVALFTMLQQRARLLDDKAVATARNLARVLQENLQGSINRIELTLLNAEDEVLRQIRQGGVSETSINKYLARLKNRIPEPDSLRISNAAGDVLYGTSVDSQERINISEREYFRQLRDQPNAGLLISEPLMGKISKKWIIVFARRLSLPDGRFAGVIIASLDVHYLTRAFGTVDVGAHGMVAMRNDAMQVIARYPANDPVIGNRFFLPQLDELRRGGAQEGVYRAISPVNSVERVCAYSRLPSNGLNLTVGLAKIDFLAELEDDKIYVSGVWCIGLLFSSLCAILIYRAWLRKEEARLARYVQAERMHAFANVSSDWFWEQDSELRFIWFSDGMRDKSGFDPAALLGRTCWEVAHKLSANEQIEIKNSLMRHQPMRDWHFPVLSDKKELRYFSLSGDPIINQDGAFLGYLGSGKDITAKVHTEKHFHHMAHHDPLTGLPNRALFDDRVEQALLLAQRTKSRLALMFVDLDKFKSVNDSYGHNVGDALLVTVAQRMRDTVRVSDTVARVGGDEFIVLLPEIEDHAHTLQVGEKLRQVLSLPFVIKDLSLHVSSSIGIVIYPDHGNTAEALVQHADRAMYQAKQAGRNIVTMFNPDQQNDGAPDTAI